MKWLLSLALFAAVGSARANCAGVVDLATELPPERVTPAGVTLQYDVDLEQDRYWLAWHRDGESGGPLGPFRLTMACETARFEWENDRFVVLSRGCGTFCWSWDVLSLTPEPRVESIERPLAHDADRHLVARYADRDLIEIRHLVTGARVEVRTRYACEFASGLCFSDLRILGDAIEYTWRETGEVLIQTFPMEALGLFD